MRFSGFAVAGMFLASSWSLPIIAAASTEPTTALPLFPGATLVEKQPPAVACGITIRGVQYQSDAKAAQAVNFFRKALPGATIWTVTAHLTIADFLMSNGKSEVRVLGTPDGIYLVYATFSKPISESQLRHGLRC
jgi:hypothetical protein